MRGLNCCELLLHQLLSSRMSDARSLTPLHSGLAPVAWLTWRNSFIAGFRTRLAAFIHHGANPWARKELAVLYGVAFLAVILLGPGRFSLDK